MQPLRRYEFLKKMFFTFFSLLENRDGHFAGLMEAKLEELGKMCPNKKDASFNVLQFCIQTNFLWVQLLRRYELFNK